MQVHWAYFACSKEGEEDLQRHWEDCQRRLISRVEALADDPAELELVADRQDPPSQWQIQSALHLPANTLVVRAAHEDPGDAVENIVSGLIEELDRLEDRPARATLRREGLHGIVPVLERCRQQQRQALVLNTVHGYPPEEIADFQDRSQDDVREDIERGRHELERSFRHEYLPTLEEQLELED
jgi:hypothetical protein